MKRAVLLAFTLFLLGAAALAESASIRVYTPFADLDPSAQGWEELLRTWQAETGNAAEDYSGVEDEAWLTALQSELSSQKADLVILAPGMGSAKDLLSAEELRGLGAASVRALPCMREEDGTVLLSPIRLGYETLFVNTDVLSSAGLSVPETWEELVIDCALLSQMGVTPIANALTEWAEIVLDCCCAIAAPGEAFGSEQALSLARETLSDLVAVGAFGADPWNAEDAAAAEDFLSGRAAMRFDSRDLLFSVPEERREAAVPIPLPGRDGERRALLPGGVSCGLAVTRACAADPGRLSAALSLTERILSPEGLALLSGTDGALAEADAALLSSCEGVLGTLYDRDPEGFDDWAEASVAALMTRDEE